MKKRADGLLDKPQNVACTLCKQFPESGDTCLLSHIKLKGKKYERLKNDDDDTCGDCGVGAGKYHHDACDLERCPRCKGQAIGCECLWTKKQLAMMNKHVKEWFKTAEKGKKYKVVKSKTQSGTRKRYDLAEPSRDIVVEVNKSAKQIKEIIIHKKSMSAKITFDDFSKHLVEKKK